MPHVFDFDSHVTMQTGNAVKVGVRETAVGEISVGTSGVGVLVSVDGIVVEIAVGNGVYVG